MELMTNIEEQAYEVMFDEKAIEWSNAARYNELFLRSVELYHTNVLEVRGHVFLNEVLDSLGLPRTQIGAITGWLSKRKGGCGYVDFNEKEELQNGVFKLRFNCDGVIWNKI